jgi:hypothetical protein
VQKEANLVKQKSMTQETAAQNIKNQHKSSIENKKIEEFKRQRCMDNSAGTLKDHQ